MKKWFLLSILLNFVLLYCAPTLGIAGEIFSPQVPFNILYAGGVEHTFIRLDHPQWDAVEFHTNASGGVIFLITLKDGKQIHYLDQESLVRTRKKFDTSAKKRDYRYAPMECRSRIGEDGRVEVTFSARTDLGKFNVNFYSSNPLKVINQVVDPSNHSMEVVPILYMEKIVSGDERTQVFLDGKPLKIKRRDKVSFTQGANFGIIFRTDRRDEKLIDFTPGKDGLTGALWIYDLEGNRVTYKIEKERDSEGYYEIKRLGNNMVQKAWIKPAGKGREVKRISTYSLVHKNKEFIIAFDPPLFFPITLQGEGYLKNNFNFKVKISNSGWDAGGEIKMVFKEVMRGIHTAIDFLPSFPEFLSKRLIHYEIVESPERYEVVATVKR